MLQWESLVHLLCFFLVLRRRPSSTLFPYTTLFRSELLFALECTLLAQALPQLDDEPLAVEVSFEVEQECLDPPFVAAVVRVDADRDGGSMLTDGTCVNAVRGNEELGVRAQIRGRKAERAAASLAGDDEALDFGGSSEQPSRA